MTRRPRPSAAPRASRADAVPAYLREGATGAGPTRPVLAFAHRGGAFHPEIEGLENTLAAFRHAADLGYRYLETDVHVTRDGVLLAFHDSVLDRVSDQRGAISSLSLAEVRRARVGGREQVPTLAELFDALPGARFNVDLKSDGAVEALADFVADRGAWDRLLVGSFSPRRLGRFRRLTGGRVATSAHPVEVAVWRLCPSARLADLLTGRRVAALQVPRERRWGRWRLQVVTRSLVRRAHAAGKHVHVWVVDDPEEMTALLDLDVDGLMTDRTDVLREVLVAAGRWREPA
ncbi:MULTISPECIES: glycerophosphodiester phosphodiesterase [Nocardioides]|uniref:glycerophosphodiester phosphodiesterase n=1 Tax=Nocardioides TaxID=1839 RepID=UPI0027DFB138|nr:glycerophosphodiester phosphodiesterase [Nocardioides sp. P86]